jgi:hypothetical protein
VVFEILNLIETVILSSILFIFKTAVFDLLNNSKISRNVNGSLSFTTCNIRNHIGLINRN